MFLYKIDCKCSKWKNRGEGNAPPSQKKQPKISEDILR